MANFITMAIIAVIIGAAIAFIIKEKKRGVRCIGCSAGGCCSRNCSCSSNFDAEEILKEISAKENACGCHTEAN